MPTILRLLCALSLYLVALLYWLLPFMLYRTHEGWKGALVFAVLAMAIMPSPDVVQQTVDAIKADPRSKS